MERAHTSVRFTHLHPEYFTHAPVHDPALNSSHIRRQNRTRASSDIVLQQVPALPPETVELEPWSAARNSFEAMGGNRTLAPLQGPSRMKSGRGAVFDRVSKVWCPLLPGRQFQERRPIPTRAVQGFSAWGTRPFGRRPGARR